MKFEFQLAGLNLSRPGVRRRRLRLALVSVALVLAGIAYWQYLHYLAHGRISILPHAATAMPGIASIKPALAAAPSAQLPPSLNKAANTGVTALWSQMLEAVNISPAIPAPQAIPANPVDAMRIPTVADTIGNVTPKPKLRRPPSTAEQRMQHAAQITLAKILDQASKFPDAYGFGPNDVFSEAKLGSPIPVHTIEEKDRANYQAGQPIKPLLQPENQWVFPVLLGSRICCMVQVKYNGRDYIPGAGVKSLGLAWSKILETWPASKGYHPLLVVNPQVPGYYFTIPELPMPNVTDIDHMFYYQPYVSPAEVILASWR